MTKKKKKKNTDKKEKTEERKRRLEKIITSLLYERDCQELTFHRG
jgi:hypothetical protein